MFLWKKNYHGKEWAKQRGIEAEAKQIPTPTKNLSSLRSFNGPYTLLS